MSTVIIQTRVPKELQFLIDLYANRKRCVSTSEAIRRLLESHPELTKLAYELYDRDSTSPVT